MLQEADHQRITDAIAAAEKTTSGKIHCVLTREISRYREVPLAWASGIASSSHRRSRYFFRQARAAHAVLERLGRKRC